MSTFSAAIKQLQFVGPLKHRICAQKLTLVRNRLRIFRAGWKAGDVGGRGAWRGRRGRCCGGVTLRTTAATLRRNWCPVTIWNLKELTRQETAA